MHNNLEENTNINFEKEPFKFLSKYQIFNLNKTNENQTNYLNNTEADKKKNSLISILTTSNMEYLKN